MPPKGLYLMLAISVGCLLKTSAQEYPFIKYTPKDGLINSRIRNVYQDSKGRLFFMTANGLSVYDGARFNNYSIEDGLANPLVNDVIEISPDSLLLATNTVVLNLWVRGKIKKVITADGYCPVINRFYRATNGVIYVASDQGLYFFRNNRFVQIQKIIIFLDDWITNRLRTKEINNLCCVKLLQTKSNRKFQKEGI